jgi:hypothetical protein
MASGLNMPKGFAEVKSLRLVAANDSTFNEVFSNSFDAENTITSLYNGAKNVLGASQKGTMGMLNSMMRGAKSLDSMAMQDLLAGIYKGVDKTGFSTLADLVSGAVLGMNIAAPQMWSGSSYSSTLTTFIKLVSPTGQPECIKKNILEPLMYLVAAASPITSYGIVYGYPLMWQVQAQGITNFRIGSIAALSIIRGSFETTFTKALQPTIIDVRLTIIPLLTDFAVQTMAAGDDKNIYKGDNPTYLGVQNPADIARGTMNEGPMAGRQQDAANVISVPI